MAKKSAKIHIILYLTIQYDHLKLLFNNNVISVNYGLLKLLLTTKLDMAAVAGRCPLAQVLRNSLSGHPPSPATTRRLALSWMFTWLPLPVGVGCCYKLLIISWLRSGAVPTAYFWVGLARRIGITR